MQLSYWEHNSFFKDIDFTIIGSGIVGLSSAIEIKRKYSTKNVLVLERGALPYGASTKNAGFACFGSPSELLEDLKTMSEDDVLTLVEKRWKGLLNLKSLIGAKDLELLELGSYELFSESEKNLFEECHSKIEFLNNFLKPIFKKDVYEINDRSINQFGFKNVQHIINNKFEGQINTGSMIKKLVSIAQELDIQILNGIDVNQIIQKENSVEIHCEGFSFSSKNSIIATNGFVKKLFPKLEVEPARAQVLVTSEIPNLKIKGTFHIEKGYYYFRNIGNRILLGGGRNLAFKEETTTKIETSTLIQQKLDQLLKDVIIPNEKYTIEMRWAGIMGVGNTKTTIVKQYSENIFVAVRMGGMGVAIGSLIGKEVAELV